QDLLFASVQVGALNHIGSLGVGVLTPILRVEWIIWRPRSGSTPITYDPSVISTRSGSTSWRKSSMSRLTGSLTSCTRRSRRRGYPATRSCLRPIEPKPRRACGDWAPRWPHPPPPRAPDQLAAGPSGGRVRSLKRALCSDAPGPLPGLLGRG